MHEQEHKKHGTDSETMKVVEEIKSAETQYDNAIALAKTNAQKILLAGKENALAEKVKAEEDALKIKNELLLNGKKEIDGSVDASLQKAKTGASKLSKKTLSETEISKLAVEFLKIELI